MPSHEYRVVPAPRRGLRVRGVRGQEARFAAAVEAEMNRMAADGWEFVRADTLPSDERRGWLGGRSTVFRSVLVFRRDAAAEARSTGRRAAVGRAEPSMPAPAPRPAPAAPLRAPPPEAPPVAPPEPAEAR